MLIALHCFGAFSQGRDAMAKNANKKPKPGASARSEPVPPGATRKALDRPLNPGGGPPGSGAGPRHAAGDTGSDIEDYGYHDKSWTAADPVSDDRDPLEKGPPYAGSSGGAVGGTPAEGRSAG